MCHRSLRHHCPMQHYRRKRKEEKKKRLVISPRCESHYINQDLVEGWEPLAMNLFRHNLSIALPTAGIVHALSIVIATLSFSSIPGHPSTLSSINSINFPLSSFTCAHLITNCSTSSTSPLSQLLQILSCLSKPRHLPVSILNSECLSINYLAIAS